MDVFSVVQTPVGPMRLVAHGSALIGAWFMDPDEPDAALLAHIAANPASQQTPDHPVLAQAARELAQWFAGERRDFTLAMAPQGTHFQRDVWDGLRDLPFGSLESYGALSRRLDRPAAVRAVAQAVGRNPISIFIPCHRIVGSNTALTGFGGGLARKRFLLALEGHAYGRLDRGAKKLPDDPGQGTLPW
jgi:methylated-DNA-[protein]-cysteine S-methyltransferase